MEELEEYLSDCVNKSKILVYSCHCVIQDFQKGKNCIFQEKENWCLNLWEFTESEILLIGQYKKDNIYYLK